MSAITVYLEKNLKRKCPRKPRRYEPCLKKSRLDNYNIADRDIEMLDTCFSNTLVLDTDSGIESLNNTFAKKNGAKEVKINTSQTYIILPNPLAKLTKRLIDFSSERTENVISSLEPFDDEITSKIKQKYSLERIPLDKDENENKNEAKIESENTTIDKNDSQDLKEENFYEKKIRDFIRPFLNRLKSKPDPHRSFDDFEGPKGLKVKLMPHQCYGTEWLEWCEKEFPHGAILADDMGLGKTITVLTYLKMKKERYEKNSVDNKADNFQEKRSEQSSLAEILSECGITLGKKKSLRTLVVLPASLVLQWISEINDKFEKNSFQIIKYQGPGREKNVNKLGDADIVFTTYETLSREVVLPDKQKAKGILPENNSPLLSVYWRRIILDEAHMIKNYSSKRNQAMCLLRAKYRITMTGTPVHNSLTDLYSLIKFLHFDPLDNFGTWKHFFPTKLNDERLEDGHESDLLLKFLADSLILRRTKKDKFHGSEKCIVDLPEKKTIEVRFKLNPSERIVYNKIFKECKEKIAGFLNGRTGKVFIFVYILRLRQACCHLSLFANCLEKNELACQISEDELNLLSNYEESEDFNHTKNKTVKSILKTIETEDICQLICKQNQIVFDTNNEINECLNKSYMSSKMSKSIPMIVDILEEHPNDKLIIVSQWTSVLDIVGHNLRKKNIIFCEIKGGVTLEKRNEIVNSFNNKSNDDLKVMLLSLSAGGVGLNLVGANRMFLLDIHWNPALEQQCADRIYRVGQTKNVTIYKLLCEETIEQRIQQIQQGKVKIAEKVCRSGAETYVPTVSANFKYTIEDFRKLFQDFD